MPGLITIERPSGGRPDAARQGAARWFTANGYAQVASSAQETHLVSASGVDQHRLVIAADAQRLVFSFGPLPAGSALDEAALTQRVDASMQARGVPPAPPARCPICATLVEPGATTCPLCGMAVG